MREIMMAQFHLEACPLNGSRNLLSSVLSGCICGLPGSAEALVRRGRKVIFHRIIST